MVGMLFWPRIGTKTLAERSWLYFLDTVTLWLPTDKRSLALPLTSVKALSGPALTLAPLTGVFVVKSLASAVKFFLRTNPATLYRVSGTASRINSSTRILSGIDHFLWPTYQPRKRCQCPIPINLAFLVSGAGLFTAGCSGRGNSTSTGG